MFLTDAMFQKVLIVALTSLFCAQISAQNSLSIWDEDGFSEARWCVSNAFTNWDRGGLWNGALQCDKQDDGNFLNSCVCRCDLRPDAESYISSYVKSECNTNTVDIQSGLLLYEAYCATALSTSCPGQTVLQGTLPTTAPATLSIWSEESFTGARSCVTDAFVNWDRGGLWQGALKCPKNSEGVFLNQCVCRSDLLPLGESYISSFVKSDCSSNPIDITSALSLYDSYCAGVLAVANARVSGETMPTQGATSSEPSSSTVSSQVMSQPPARTRSTSSSTPTATSPASEGLSESTSSSPSRFSSTSSTSTSTNTEPSTAPSSAGGSSANTEPSNSPSFVGGSESAGGGTSQADRIALGVGIGLGLPTAIATLVLCWYELRKRKTTVGAHGGTDS